VIYGKPSAELADRLESDEKARIDIQIKRLGQSGLAKAANELNIAQAYNDRPIPREYLTSFPLPNVGSISWIPVQSFLNEAPNAQKATPAIGSNELARHVTQDSSDLPFFVQYTHVKVQLFSG
jgi:Zn-dependent M16 (insulinase) family peptidase